MEPVTLIHADCREAIKGLASDSVDSCVTDPPYALVSIQKRFGKPGSAPAQEGADGLYRRASAGFMGQQWDTGETAFDPDFWREVYRVLKPGAHVVAFSGTRTYHRMACAIEDAGFEIRDQIAWLYGSGFPKSHNIGKAIDKMAGAERPVIATETVRDIRNGHGRGVGDGINASARGEPVYMERQITGAATAAAAAWDGWGTALKPALEPICLARKPLDGTVAANVLAHGTGALNIDGCRVDAERLTGWGGKSAGGDTWNGVNSGLCKDGEARPVDGRWPANVVHDGSDEVVTAFPNSDGQQGDVRGTEPSGVTDAIYGKFSGRVPAVARNDSGSAARFFYSAKADAEDRLGSKHPTVKPVALMRWLVRLVTPPGGVTLDPFAGSGTTGVAALAEGMRAILIEREAEFAEDIRLRLAHARGQGAHSAQLKHRKREVRGEVPLFTQQEAGA